MRIECRNIGKLSHADVEISSVTVIAGLNSTGKSTVGKALYCIFNSFYNFDEETKKAIPKRLSDIIESSAGHFFGSMKNPIDSLSLYASQLYDLRSDPDEEKIKEIIKDFISDSDIEEQSIIVKEIYKVLDLSDDDIHKMILQKKFRVEFDNQIKNLFSSNDDTSEVKLTIKGKDTIVNFKDNLVTSVENFQNMKTEAIYMDDPFVLDNMGMGRWYVGFNGYNHRSHLRKKLIKRQNEDFVDAVIDELLASATLKNIYDKLNEVCKGRLQFSSMRGDCSFKFDGSSESLSIKNVSTGMKTFVIIQQLLLNGTLEKNGTLILDEPEIHLHPEWQKLFAEIIVLLQKDYGLHILINSHSPYFIEALEVYTKKYGIQESARFYLAEDSEDGNSATIRDVSDNLEPMYKLLYKPLQDLDDESFMLEK